MLFNATFLVFVPTVVLIFSYRIIVFCSVNDCMSNNSVHINLLPAMFFFQVALLLNATFLLFGPSVVLIFCYSTIVFFLCKRLQIKEHMALSNIGLSL